MRGSPYKVVDLFSGAGGMSLGFQAHRDFTVVGAADAQVGKPSSPLGSLRCNGIYRDNIGVDPLQVDLGRIDPGVLREVWGLRRGELDVLVACPPCSGFTRITAANHLRDDPRNSLVGRVAAFVAELRPKVMLLENARELVKGKQRHHLEGLAEQLVALGYEVDASSHMLSRFGLPQLRERAVVVAVDGGLPLRTMADLWRGWEVRPSAVTVRRAIGKLPPVEAGRAHPEDPMHVSPSFRRDRTMDRMRAIPADGGSWADLVGSPETEVLLNPAQRKIIEAGRWGSHPDVYGRMWWDEPARTIKRECAHVGNGRYAHPEQHRLCTVREMALLQGFPRRFRFDVSVLGNAYRHLGDAVPPLISYQLASLVRWMLSGVPPTAKDLCLPGTSLRVGDIRPVVPSGLVA
ncbi:DNA cytosine methyltransferase [Saccharothrix coeruleofusca]|uniref:DNA (cytosine-5-)-methyltransferase n=1 Tax=Saccharothrix coeruleofusca TaxID=33919 RepID=A0A918AH80_9PSEU|nr:DNA cytosine methyltransferase [Saccharothrix coeruleofusca]MBP2340183.1 DNA (cytosine-5)-methyltransferase 1 [Saccharothrix coeruleofusca]GGP36853.1 cytosine-specific methyltransferase [Saccharothrix coeruleofusca]